MLYLLRLLSIHLFVTGIVISGNCSALELQNSLVWSKKTESQYNLYYSKQVQGQWSAPVIIASDDTPIILPTLAKNTNNEIWVVWNVLRDGKGRLRYCHFQNEKWGESYNLKTQNETDMAPSLHLDTSGTPWLVWAGLNGDDDIFFSRWDGKRWTDPELINSNDAWPDILPVISNNEAGQLQVKWTGYDGRNYVSYISIWNGQQWTPEEELTALSEAEEIPNEIINPVARISWRYKSSHLFCGWP